MWPNQSLEPTPIALSLPRSRLTVFGGVAQLSTLGHTFMKKTLFTILWMFVFFIMGSWIFAGIGTVIGLFFHHPYNETLDRDKLLAVQILACIATFGFPILGLILGIRGKLPGTGSKKHSK
jgi:hypothetical protein